jgi:class 3 adenylate cyclase
LGVREAGRTVTATVLFTDLVGSTELLSRIGEAEFDRLRRIHFDALRQCIGDSGGDEIKTLGDGILAVFNSAADAVACAVSMQQAVHRQSQASSTPLVIRVGLALGDVAFEEHDVFGTPVVEAARLVGVARSGQILTTGLVRMAAGGRSTAPFKLLGMVELKGLPEPVLACEVPWEVPAPPAPTLPQLLSKRGRIFVGRDAEMEILSQTWKEAAAGDPQVLLLAGEPGMGKTRLAAELALRVHSQGAIVLAGRCDEDLGVPFQPFVEALRHFVDHTAAGELGPKLGRYGGELARLVPELSDRAGGLAAPVRADPETEQYRLFDAVAAWLSVASSDGPVMLVLDDVHWAAKPTLLLLRHVIRSAEPMKLLILATYRDTELGRTHPLAELMADLRRDSGVRRLQIGGIDARAVAAFMEAAAGNELGEDERALAHAIWSETGGNAFFVIEVLRHLTETGAFVLRDGRWVAAGAVEDAGIPEAIREVVGRRLSRLSDDANKALAVAAVVGLEFDLAVIEESSDFDPDALLSGLEEAVTAGLVDEVPGARSRYRFSHALVRATLYDELSGPRRARLHRRVGDAIESIYGRRLDDHLSALAHHYGRAAAPAADPAKAVAYATRAGDRALAQLAHDEAAGWYGQALELLDDAEGADHTARLELLIALGEAQRRAGNPAYRRTLLDAAHLAGAQRDPEALARAALANNRGILWSAGGIVDVERTAAVEAALAALGDEDSEVRARLLANLSLELVFAKDPDRCRDLSDTALAVARRLGDPATLAQVLIARYYAVGSPATLDERLANTAELLDLAGRLDDPLSIARAWQLRFRAAMESGDGPEADRCLDAQEQITLQLHQPGPRWLALVNRTGRTLALGRIDEAERLAEETYTLGRIGGEADALLYYEVFHRYGILFERDRLAELEERIGQRVSRFPDLAVFRAMAGRLFCETGRPAEAHEALRRIGGGNFGAVPLDIMWPRTMTDAAAISAFLDDTEAAAAIYELLVGLREQVVVIASGVVTGSVSHYLGMLATTLGHFDDAEQHFLLALPTLHRIGASGWAARTNIEWARMLVRRSQGGDPDQARRLAAEALTSARQLGLTNVERHAVEVLHQCS